MDEILDKYESSNFRAFRRHRLYFDNERPSPFTPLSDYLDLYVNELISKHNEWFHKEIYTLQNFDVLENRWIQLYYF